MALIGHKLLPTPSDAEKKVRAIIAKLSKLDRQNPSKASGRHALMKDLSMAGERTRAALGKAARKRLQQRIMVHHVASHARASAEQKASDERTAQANAELKRRQILIAREALMGQLKTARDALTQAKAQRPPLTLSSAQWSSEETLFLSEALRSEDLQPSNVLRARAKALAPPQPMSNAFFAALDAQEVAEFQEGPARETLRAQLWLSTAMARQRHGWLSSQ